MRARLAILAPGVFLVTLCAATAAQEARPDDVCVSTQDGRLTARIKNLSLAVVLEELARCTRVEFVADDAIREDAISADLLDVPLDEAVRQLFRPYDTFLYYAAVGDSPSALRTVWIYPKGAAMALRPVPPETWAGTGELEASLTDSEPKVRERTYEALMERPSDRGRELILDAIRGISEEDQGLRQRLLSNAASKGMEIPPDLLADLVHTDGSEGMRLMALDALATSAPGMAKQAAEAALNDPSQSVRERAADILGQRHHP